MNIIKDKGLPLKEYFPTAYKKERICLHHTCGTTAEGAISWWKQKSEKVGTAYLVDKDGIVTEAFNDSFYAYQYGLKNMSNRLDLEKSSIGIEIVNEGGLYERNGKIYTDWNKEYTGEVVRKSWRDYKVWASYTEQQYAAVAELIKRIAEKHDLSIKLNESIEFNINVFKTHTVINHANVRLDKTDLSPAFDFEKLKKYLA
jgi:N-acetyl-anhydromuramyl-L-alanine amidase AmpD